MLGSLEDIDGAEVDLERIAAGSRRDDRRVTESPTQLRDLRLQRVALGRNPLRTPQVLDESLDPAPAPRHPGQVESTAPWSSPPEPVTAPRRDGARTGRGPK